MVGANGQKRVNGQPAGAREEPSLGGYKSGSKERSRPVPDPARIVLRPGTRLVRDWQGKSHSVDVRADGLSWNGTVYRSLSAVALAITGARWSGNRFFRL